MPPSILALLQSSTSKGRSIMSRLFLILISFLCSIDVSWLNIANLSAFFSILASVAVIVSLVFIAQQLTQQTLQVKQQTKLARAGNSQSFVNLASSFVLAIGSNSFLMNLYQTGGDRWSSLSPEEQVQYRYLVSWWLTFFENVQYQQDCGLLDAEVYNAWMKDMEAYFRRRRVDLVWDHLKGNYSDSFVSRFQKSIDNVRKEFQQKQLNP